MFDDYTTIVSKAKYEPKLGKVLKILTLKQKIGQKIYSLNRAREITKKYTTKL